MKKNRQSNGDSNRSFEPNEAQNPVPKSAESINSPQPKYNHPQVLPEPNQATNSNGFAAGSAWMKEPKAAPQASAMNISPNNMSNHANFTAAPQSNPNQSSNRQAMPKPAASMAQPLRSPVNKSNVQPLAPAAKVIGGSTVAKVGPKRRYKFKWFDAVLIAIIILLILASAYFWLAPIITRKKQQELSNELFNIIPVTNEIKEDDLQGIYVDPDANKVEGERWEVFASGEESYTKGQKILIRPIARLQIDSIDLSLPILDKAGLVELRYGIGHYESSANLFSSKGLSVLFGHHMIERGHYFNRLDEVKVNDKVRIIGNGQEYTYTVDKRLVVEPQELLNLIDQPTDDKYLLMITCVGPNFDQRLLVYAKLSTVEPIKSQP